MDKLEFKVFSKTRKRKHRKNKEEIIQRMAAVYTNVKNNSSLFKEDYTLELLNFVTKKQFTASSYASNNSDYAKQEFLEALGKKLCQEIDETVATSE